MKDYEKYDEKDVNRYINLIKSISVKLYKSYKPFVSELDYEDMQQEAIVSLMKRLKNFDSERGASSTFATVVIDKSIKQYINKLKTGGTGRKVTGIFVDVNKNDTSFFETISTEEQDHSSFYFNEIMEQIKDLIYFDDFKRSLDGETYEQIAKTYGVSIQRISQKIDIFRKRARKRLELIGINGVK